MMSGPFPGFTQPSEVGVVTNNGQIANGTYSVQFFYTFAQGAPNAEIKTSDTVLAQCKLTDQQNWYSPERSNVASVRAAVLVALWLKETAAPCGADVTRQV